MGVLAAITVALSFVAQLVLIAYVGDSEKTDAYFAAIVIPQALFNFFVTSLSLVLTPQLAAIETHRRCGEAWTLVHGVGVAFAIFGFALGWSGPWWLGVVLPGFSAELIALTGDLMRAALVGAVAGAVGVVTSSWLRAEERFVVAEVGQSVGAVALILTIVGLAPWIGVYSGPLSLIARYAVELGIGLWCLGPYRLPRIDSPILATTARRLLPLCMGGVVFRTDLIVDRFIASMAPAGGLTILALTRQLMHALTRLMNKSLVVTATPQLARTWRAGEWRPHLDLLTKRWNLLLRIAGFCFLPVAASWPLLYVASRLGLNTGLDIDASWNVWIIAVSLGGILIAEPVALLGNAAHFARGDSLTPTRQALVSFVISVALRWAGFSAMGLPGLALGISAYFLLQALLTWRSAFSSKGLPAREPALSCESDNNRPSQQERPAAA